jgi:hypothetical protein
VASEECSGSGEDYCTRDVDVWKFNCKIHSGIDHSSFYISQLDQHIRVTARRTHEFLVTPD